VRHLSPDIVRLLAQRLGKRESTVRKDIYLLRTSYPASTPNAVAQVYARTPGLTVYRTLDAEDKATLPSLEFERSAATIKQRAARPRPPRVQIVELVRYDATDFFRRGHIDEINRAYTYGCYTSVFVLLRKLVENMLIDILRHRFPGETLEDKELYFDTKHNRYKDLSVIIKNLRDSRAKFDQDGKLVERITQIAGPLRETANDKAHSWFHLVRKKKEIDDLDPQMLIELIATLEKNIGFAA
jgi:hypothetical protein